MRTRFRFPAAAVVLCVPAAAATYEAPLDARKDGEARFTSKPSAKKSGKNVRISFAVSAATDVEVAVLDSKGKVVRHLAAGLLGRNAPAPFRKGSLRQGVLWDGKDDAGRPAAGRPFKARMRLGSRARLERIAGWDGNSIGSGIVGLAVGKGGEVYVLDSEGSRGRSALRVLDRTGKYLRTIIPYPANTPRARAESVGYLEIDGERLPIVYNGHGHNLHPMTSGMKTQTMCFSPKGYLIVASAVGTICEHGPLRHLLAFHPEGGAPEGVSFVGPRLRRPLGMMGGAGEGHHRARDNVAASPDGEWIYFTQNIYSRPFARQRAHGVFRLRWTDKWLAEPFLGKKEPGADDEHFNDPQGVAVDRKGNIYVSDRGNNRVMIFSSEGKLLGKFPVESPEQVFVHAKSGEIYLTSRGIDAKRERPERDATIRKFSARRKGQPGELASLEARRLSVVALDPRSSPPRLWAAYGGKLVAITDQGGRLQPGAPVSNANGLAFPTFLAADPDRDRVVVDDTFARNDALTVLDLRTGRKSPFARGTDVALDREGNVYIMDGYGKNSVSRYDPSGKPLPFPATGSHRLDTGVYRGYGPNLGMRGICVAPGGKIYVLRSNNYGLEDGTAAKVDVFGPEGKHAKSIVTGLGHGDCGLGVDARGNVYVGVNVKPGERPLPEAFVSKVPSTVWRDWRRGKRELPWWYTYYNAYLFHMGAVMKFGPGGGTLYGNRPNGYKGEPHPLWDVKNAPAGAIAYRSGYLRREIRVKGALWRYPGCGIIATSDLNWGDPCCMCMTSHLAVDEYGRVFVPNVFRFSVEILDTNGNHIARIGRYGNADSAGPGSRLPEPEIAFAWPAFVSAAGGKLYVSDSVNRRVTVVRFEHAAVAECPLP